MHGGAMKMQSLEIIMAQQSLESAGSNCQSHFVIWASVLAQRISTKYTRSMNINEWNNSTGNFTWNGQNGNFIIATKSEYQVLALTILFHFVLMQTLKPARAFKPLVRRRLSSFRWTDQTVLKVPCILYFWAPLHFATYAVLPPSLSNYHVLSQPPYICFPLCLIIYKSLLIRM
jgi:hypothetical protein